MTTFNQAVELSAWSDGFADSCQNRDFDGGSLSFWTPLNTGSTPGPYEVLDSVFGSGKAFVLKPDTALDGISQDITLRGGETYILSARYCLRNTHPSAGLSGGMYGRILVNDQTVAQCNVINLGENSLHPHWISGTFTPAADGTYTIKLISYTQTSENYYLSAYFDDVSVNFAPQQHITTSPGMTGQFVDGVWTSSITINDRVPATHFIARYADIIGNSGSFSTYSSALDLDGDGLLDSWEKLYFPSAAACSPTADDDGDGYSNSDEYIAGTNPVQKSSCLALSASSGGNNQCILNWLSVDGRSYDVQWTPNLVFVPFSDVSTDIGHPQGSYTNDAAIGGSQGFYRIKVRKK
jgi:hypothetical protein